MKRFNLILAALTIFTAAFATTIYAEVQTNTDQNKQLSIFDTSAKGVFNIGQSKGQISRSYDADLNKSVLKFDYTLPPGTAIGVWTKFSAGQVNRDDIKDIDIDVRLADSAQVDDLTLKLEVKGTEGIQNIPLNVKRGWNSIKQSINWNMIGSLKEVVYVVVPKKQGQEVSGTLYFDFVLKDASVPVSVPVVAATSAVVPAPVKETAPETLVSDRPAVMKPEPKQEKEFNLLNAGQLGAFNVGEARGHVTRSTDKGIADDKDILKLKYSAPKGTVIGVWTKGYPKDLNASNIDAAKVGVYVPQELAGGVAVKVELKGSKSRQVIPTRLKAGWNYVEEFISWNLIGELDEFVFVVNSIGKDKPEEGVLYFDVVFSKSGGFSKFSASGTGKMILLFLFAIFVAILGFFIKDFFPNKPKKNEDNAKSFSRDLLYGLAIVQIAVVSLAVYILGAKSVLDSGLSFLIIGLAGAVIAEILKYRLTGKHLTAGQIFQNVLFTGLLAATASRQVLLQAPATWSQVLMKSNLTAALACLIYHAFNAYSLSSAGRHIKASIGALIVGTPFFFGWLLMLENATLVQSLSNGLTLGMFSSWPAFSDTLGRLIIIFGFNLVVTNAISLATKGRFLKNSKAHWSIFFVSFALTLAPSIANLGSIAAIGAMPMLFKSIFGVLATMLSQAGLWAEVYLITGMILDASRGHGPTQKTIFSNSLTGMKKGMAYSGIFMAIVYIINMLINAPGSQSLMNTLPVLVGILLGGLAFPLIKTIIETFDGSHAFLPRVRYSYKNAVLYGRGAVIGFGVSLGIVKGMFEYATADRILYGLCVGLVASVGVSVIRDIVNMFKGRGQIYSWKVYMIDALLGGFIGSAVAFYMDSSQVPAVIQKFKLYNSAGAEAKGYTIYPLVSKWGRVDLGTYCGGVKLFFNEALSGVINWAVAAWLFAINRTFMQAFFQRDKAPIKFFFSKAGMVELSNHMIHVLRWGLWMAPIINTFLRMMGDPTWYNQDGACRTVVVICQNLTMGTGEFQAWSLKVFISLLAYDFFRILIWIDHMGLRVATLVNLSFLGMDKLDEKIARFLGKTSTQSCIPEAVKRFTTWGPLLIPFYIPRGESWDFAWDAAAKIQASSANGGLASLAEMPLGQKVLYICFAIFGCAVISSIVRGFGRRSARKTLHALEISNREYKVMIKENGGGFSHVIETEHDISRPSYDLIDPCGRALFVVDGDEKQSWPVLGNFPKDKFAESHFEKTDDTLKITNVSNDIKTTMTITLPDTDATAEIWTITVENLEDKKRSIKIVPYLEWMLSKSADDRFHTQYARLFAEMEYESEVNSMFAWHRKTDCIGILASDIAPEGFVSSRMDFIGRAKSLWKPRILETLGFIEARDYEGHPTFDPIGSLNVGVEVDAKSSKTVKLMIGVADDRDKARALITQYLQPRAEKKEAVADEKRRKPLIGHGEILPGTPQPYSEYIDDGNKLLVKTPYTTRPYDHAMSNGLGHFVMVTNRGLHTSSNGNSQQNRITPDGPDTVTREIPGEAIYLYEPSTNEWFSPTHHPLNDEGAKNECEFGVDGTSVFRMSKGNLSTEMTVFVPTDERTGVYILKIKNDSDKLRHMRIAPYFQIVLAGQPEWSGQLKIQQDKSLDALYFENPRNSFRIGPAFASMSVPVDKVETKRGKFFGTDRGVTNPFMVEVGTADDAQLLDDRPVAAFLGSIDVPAKGEKTIVCVLGQTDNKKKASAIIKKYKSVEKAQESLEKTKQWWLNLMKTAKLITNNKEFDYLQNWLKYQAIAERIWARRGFYQTSGAFGFRDQLQDTVNLIWVDPALARKQIILHASQQFIEGDVVHWFHTLHDGRTAFSNRSHASDNLLWLAWGVTEYLNATGDESLLDEMTSYLKSDLPFQPLPKNKHGWGTIYQRSATQDTVYRHCLKSIDLVFEKRMGENGLPLIGTGDWNDGLDEIGSEGRGESVWLAFFLYYILKTMINVIEKKDGPEHKAYYMERMEELKNAIELTWRDDRYLRAIHDDGTEIGVKGSGYWEIDALTAAWAVKAGINEEREEIVFNTAMNVLERDNVVLLGWPALREDTKPYLGRSSKYPEGVRENGMYCHGVQWMIKAARILVERAEAKGDEKKAAEYREIAYRLWLKITPIAHVTPKEIEIYGGQPNKQPADILTTFDQGRMIWNGYTGAAGWLLRQAFEGVVGAKLVNNKLVLPDDLDKPRGDLKIKEVYRDVGESS